MESVPGCMRGHINVTESNLRKTQTRPKDPRTRSAATAGCFETCFNIIIVLK